MAKNTTGVLLGFEDEPITEKYKDQLNFTINKIGGKPDYPNNIKLEPPKCPLCQLPRLLVVQIYAPLDNSIFHRILYLFACINPNCWNASESWLCIRVQTQEKIVDIEEEIPIASKTSITEWCIDADDWDDNNANFNEENGNVINNTERVSDEDDESCSLEDSLRSGFGNLTVNDNDKNANKGAQGGAVGRLHSPAATAEIEGNEGEVISIDSPTFPQHDITALLQEVTPLPQEICHVDSRRTSLIYFSPIFMSVYEETVDKQSSNISDRHVKELLQDYQQKNENVNVGNSEGGGEEAQGGEALEKYEKSNPAHGDKMFHNFLSKIQANQGQLLRYARESAPLLLYRPHDIPKHCNYCQGEMVFELQLVPTIISKLKLVTDAKPCARLEFGTILVYTCRKSCWSTDTTFRIETVILQAETY